MARKIPQDIKRKVKKMRHKYFGDIASEHYLKTGEPILIKENVKKADDDIAEIMKRNEANTKEAKKNQKRGRRTKKEYNTIFI